MKPIAYVVPYFGKLPGKGFALWLLSCAKNPTVDWILFTDDHTEYCYPDNVKVNYTSFEDIKARIQSHFDFPIVLDRGWKLCDFRPAYGEIFSNELQSYDVWGYCDVDLMWGNIREFIPDEILEKYEKVGFLGHSALYKNTPEVNIRYRTIISGAVTYKDAFSGSKGYAFDEVGIEQIYNALKIPYYKEVHFANLTKYELYFHLDLMPPEDEYKNRRQIFTWLDGKVIRWYLDKSGEIKNEEFMYIHFWCRPMTYKVSAFSPKNCYTIYSDCITDNPVNITPLYIKYKGRKHPVTFYVKSIWKNRHKLTLERIVFNLHGAINSRR